MQIGLRHLYYFVVVAEELHFGRAAVRLKIAQPPLSQQIIRLERELKVVLFDRTKRQIELTSAGHAFLARARRLLADFDDSILTVQRAHRGEAGQLVLGTIPTGMSNLYTEILPLFRARHPHVRMVVRSLSTTKQMHALHNGQIDIAVLRLPVDDRLLEVRGVSRDSLVVALPANHPKAKCRSLSLMSIADEQQVMFPRNLAPEYYDFIVGLFKKSGVSIVQEAEHIQTHLGLISGGFGVSLVPKALTVLQYQGVVYRPLKDPGIFVDTGIAFLRGKQSALIRAFLNVVNEVTDKK